MNESIWNVDDIVNYMKDYLCKPEEDNKPSKEGYPRRVFRFGGELGDWELIMNSISRNCFARPIGNNVYKSTVKGVPVNLFYKNPSEFEEFLEKYIEKEKQANDKKSSDFD
jgi:hypothetical protein